MKQIVKKFGACLVALMMLVSLLPGLAIHSHAADETPSPVKIEIFMEDAYADTWDGASLKVYAVKAGVATLVGTADMTAGNDSELWTYEGSSDYHYVFVWSKGSFDLECHFEIWIDDVCLYHSGDLESIKSGAVYATCTLTDGSCSVCGFDCGTTFPHGINENRYACEACDGTCDSHDWSKKDGFCVECSLPCLHPTPSADGLSCVDCGKHKEASLVHSGSSVSTSYWTFRDAAEASETGLSASTITLLSDTSWYDDSFDLGTVTIDLNGFALNGSISVNGADVTIIDSKGGGELAADINVSSGTLILDGSFPCGHPGYSNDIYGGTLDLRDHNCRELGTFNRYGGTILLPDGFGYRIDNVYSDTLPDGVMATVGQEKITVSFDANGGEGTMADVTIPFGEYVLPDSTFTGQQEFLGWSTEPDGALILDGALHLNFDTTLYAVWGKDVSVYVAGVGMEDGDYLAVGSTTTTKTLPRAAGGYAHYANGVLTLNNYSIDDVGFDHVIAGMETKALLFVQDELTIRLVGENELNGGEHSEAITAFDTLRIEGTGSLRGEIGSGICVYQGGLDIEDAELSFSTEDCAVDVFGDTTFKGATITVEDSNYSFWISDGSLWIEDTTVSAHAEYHGICAMDSDVTVCGRSDIALTTETNDGIYMKDGELTVSGGRLTVENEKEDSIELNGSVFYLTGGEVVLTSIDEEAIEADGTDLYISGGSLKAYGCEDAIDGYLGDLVISGGEVYLSSEDTEYTSEDDGIYWDSGDVTISGGEVHIVGGGDGISVVTNVEPNDGEDYGSITISGGHVIIETCEDGGCGILSDGDLTLSGGTVEIRAGDSALAPAFNTGLYADGNITLSGTDLTVDTQTYSIAGYRVLGTDGGNVYVEGGNITLSSPITLSGDADPDAADPTAPVVGTLTVDDKVTETDDGTQTVYRGDYTVTLQPSGPAVDVRTVSSGSTFYIPGNYYTYDGYIFLGWARTAKGTPISEEFISLTGNLTLYAVWWPICDHDWRVSYNEDYHYMQCRFCGETDGAENHNIVVTGSTPCTVQTFCNECGYVDEAASGHTFGFYRATENYHYTKCEVCGVYAHKGAHVAETDNPCDDELRCEICRYLMAEATGHSFTNYVPDGNATCTEDGTKTAKCDHCDETDTVADEGSATGHTFGEYLPNDDATCETDGTKTAKCENCDATDTVADEGSATCHAYGEYVPDGNATCEVDGTKTATCENCDATDTVTDEGSATGHTFGEYTPDGNATCTEDGTKTATCENCDATDTVADEGSATGHTFENYLSDGNATCEEDGTKTAKCENCDATDTVADEGSAAGHTFENYLSDGNATCEADGTKTAKCENCDATDTVADEGSATGHTYGEYTSDGNATCEADGTKTAKCENCDATDTVADEGSATGHAFEDYKSDGNATCEADGTKTAKCENCDKTDTVADEGSAKGHSFKNYKSDGNATCTGDGTKTAKCENCDKTDTQLDAGSAKGHTYEDGLCTACGAEDPDYTNLTWVYVTVPSVSVLGGLGGWLLWRKKRLG